MVSKIRKLIHSCLKDVIPSNEDRTEFCELFLLLVMNKEFSSQIKSKTVKNRNSKFRQNLLRLSKGVGAADIIQTKYYDPWIAEAGYFVALFDRVNQIAVLQKRSGKSILARCFQEVEKIASGPERSLLVQKAYHRFFESVAVDELLHGHHTKMKTRLKNSGIAMVAVKKSKGTDIQIKLIPTWQTKGILLPLLMLGKQPNVKVTFAEDRYYIPLSSEFAGLGNKKTQYAPRSKSVGKGPYSKMHIVILPIVSQFENALRYSQKPSVYSNVTSTS
jgi:hypothetical protein